MSKVRLVLLLLIVQSYIKAQVVGDLNTAIISELDAVQTPSGDWINSSMEFVPDLNFDYRVIIHRSIDNGYNWEVMDSLEMRNGYFVIGDPVLSMDIQGNIYLLIMEYVEGSNFNLHLTLYISEDEGQNWSIRSQPYTGQKFADTPHLLIDANNTFYISYTEYNNDPEPPSIIHFIKSEDGGNTWTSPKIFEPIQSEEVIGSNFNFSEGNQINLAYGDFTFSATYFTISHDFGDTWSDPIEFPNTFFFAVNKVISNINHENICVLTHRAHDPTSGIHNNYSLDNGLTWNSYRLADNASMAEGYMDDNGHIHLTYNQIIDNEFEVIYVYSNNGGATFSDPVVLFSGPTYIDFPLVGGFENVTGESQSMILGQDNMFHLTFVDWSDSLKAKHLIFEPFDLVSSISNKELEKAYELSIFPNPSSDLLNLQLTDPEQFSSWNINAIDGKKLISGSINSNNSLNISSLEPGTYLLSVQSDNQIIVKKFIKI